MTAPPRRKALGLLPVCATTGIGSLPLTQGELALQMALQLDVPYAPQLPRGRPEELMVPQALEGLPGLAVDADGGCTVDAGAWEAGRAALEARLSAALAEGPGGLARGADLLPSPEAWRTLRPFLFEVEARKLPFAKVQLAGPCTVRWVARTAAGAPLSSLPALDAQVYRLVLARALALARAVRQAGATPLFFLDEPGLYALDPRDPAHLLALQELRLVVAALQREGALVGLHCCGNTHWGLLLGLGLDVLSLDVRLSLDALVEEREALERFLEGGSTLSLGIVPTDLASTYAVEELVGAVETAVRSALAPWAASQVLLHALLTPACGLAMRSVPDAERILDEVRQAQRLLRREALAAGEGRAPTARA
jgi:methionine synthase II (cobalamin-independent)